MGIFVRAVITGFGLSLGKLIFDEAKKRILGDEESSREPQRVIIDNWAELARRDSGQQDSPVGLSEDESRN